MLPDDKLVYGIIGTAVSATGAGLSITELQAIISIIITISGFIISVLVPLCIKLYHKIKEAKKDGKITKEEISDGLDTLQEGVEGVKNIVDDTKKKGDK